MSLWVSRMAHAQAVRPQGQQCRRHRPEHQIGHRIPGCVGLQPDQVDQLLHVFPRFLMSPRFLVLDRSLTVFGGSPCRIQGAPHRCSNSWSLSVRRSSSTMAASAPTSTRNGVAGYLPRRRPRRVRPPRGPAGRPGPSTSCRCRPLRVQFAIDVQSVPGQAVLHPRCDVPGLDDHRPEAEMAELEVQPFFG